jgi:arylsulfatase
MIPHIDNRSYSISAELEIPETGAEGVLVAEADLMGGFSLYVQDGKVHHTYSLMGVDVRTLTSSEKVPTGKVEVKYEFTADKPGMKGTGGRGRLFINGKQVGETKLPHTVPVRFSSYSGMDIGKDNGEVVSPTYGNKAPFAFTGKIGKVVFELAPGGMGARERRELLQDRILEAMRN